ncbi:hypothetical protein K402DRAFT_30979 [Aulographum hederae CBS 113979]|uniref:Secreted protein n=1 Tax=Aulographum hederae CBS 113979 TaxID=1176131 RepID=A0A6G1H4Q0_9PEZI|nr:hypothetical protein K402DRAFT_30979 [Aulographum hederae CBS 113979]
MLFLFCVFLFSVYKLNRLEGVGCESVWEGECDLTAVASECNPQQEYLDVQRQPCVPVPPHSYTDARQEVDEAGSCGSWKRKHQSLTGLCRKGRSLPRQLRYEKSR